MSATRQIVNFLELIDTCWDVNISTCAIKFLDKPELIDTCWDVNQSHVEMNFARDSELIDTCWDVNQDSEVNWWYSV